MQKMLLKKSLLALSLLFGGVSANAFESETEFSYSLHVGSLNFVRKEQTVFIAGRGQTPPRTLIYPEYSWEHTFVQAGATSRFGEYIDVEFRFGFGTSDSDTAAISGQPPETLKRSTRYLLGAYGRIYNHDWDTWRPYLLLGFTQQAASEYEEAGFSIGTGVQYSLTDEYRVSAEFMQFTDNSNFSSKGFTLSFNYYYD